MRQARESKNARKLLLLGLLLMALALLVSGGKPSQPAYAAQCCDLCGPDYDVCMLNCNGNSACEQNCWYTLDSCNHHCVFCGNGLSR